jgi:hypothetical protein
MRGVFVLIACSVATTGQPAVDLADAAKSPIALARYIDTHIGFAWEPLWAALGVDTADALNSYFRCENRVDCKTDLLTFSDPDQTILLITNDPWQTYLRYFGTSMTGWRFAGAYTPMPMRYFKERHGALRFHNKPFLRIASQGASGSDVGSEYEEWFDLTQPDFKPVFSFSPQGWGLDYVTPEPPVIVINHRYKELASAIQGDPGETIRLHIEVSFTGRDDSREFDLGSAGYDGVYSRDQGQKMFTLRAAYTALNKTARIPNERFQALDGSFYFKNEEVLFYLLNRLKQIASGPDSAEKGFLRSFLTKCKDTPEKRALQALMK